MRTKMTTLYEFHELSDEAKETALDACRDFNVNESFWHEDYTEKGGDFHNIAEILGINLEGVYFSGFWSQGDGACFTGTYSYAKGAAAAIRQYAPLNEDLHAIADALADVQRRNFYQLGAVLRHEGRYNHEYSVSINVERTDEHDPTEDAEDLVTEALRNLMRWLYKSLEKEYEYLTSDEAVKESIEANEYEFTEDGNLA